MESLLYSIIGITNAREAMKKLPEEDKAKIAQQVHFKSLNYRSSQSLN